MTIVAILVATGVPWFASGFEVNIGMASWGLLALGGLHVAFTMLAYPARIHGRWRDRTLTLLDILGVILIAFIWQHVGALQNPMFLFVFALPVVGAIFLSRWHPYLIAAISIIAVAVVALSQAPELRWYASVLLEVFAILLLACAVAAEYVGTIFERLNAHIVMARTEAERGQEMWAGLIERLPLPALLIDPDSMRIVASSEFATIYLRAGELPIE